jgi:DnaJ-class molecular chaperone
MGRAGYLAPWRSDTLGPMPEEDLYALLGVVKGTTDDEVRTAYRKLARKHHPDVNPGDKQAEDRFKEISFAYDVLSDPEKRARYDEFGRQGLEAGFDPEQARAFHRWSEGARRSPYREHDLQGDGDFDLEELLSRLRGPGGFEGADAFRSVPRRGRDAQAEIEIDFLDAVLAREVAVEIEGRGRLRVRVPGGADAGTRVRLAGQGEAGVQNGPPGDLLLTLRVRSHPFFRRDGDDLLLDVPVTVPELVLGASVDVPTPDGSATVRVPAHSRPGARLRLRGKGAATRAGGRGDLLLRLEVALPEAGGERLEEVAKSMEPLYEGRDVRAKLRGAK